MYFFNAALLAGLGLLIKSTQAQVNQCNYLIEDIENNAFSSAYCDGINSAACTAASQVISSSAGGCQIIGNLGIIDVVNCPTDASFLALDIALVKAGLTCQPDVTPPQ